MKKTVLFILLLAPFALFAQPRLKGFQWNVKASASNRVIEGESYIVTAFKPYFYYEKFYGALNLDFSFDPDGSLKQDDWDNWRAVSEKLAYLGYGEKGTDPVFFRFGNLPDVTLGFGMLVRHFRNDIYYPVRTKLGFFGGYDFGYNGLTAFVEDSFDLDLMGGRVFFRPLYAIEAPKIPEFFKLFQFGISFVMDADPLDQESSGDDIYLTKDNPDSRTVRVYGVDMSMPLTDNDYFSMDNYVQYGDIQKIGAGIGYGLKGDVLKLINYQMEVRYSWDGFIPSYFNSYYDVRDIRSNRYEEAKNAPDGWGYLIALDTALFEGQWTIGVELEDATAGNPQLLLYTYLYPSLLKRFYLKFSYQRRDIISLMDAFEVEDLSKSLIVLELGYEVTTNASISVRYIKNFREEDGIVSGNSLTEVQTSLLF